MTSRQKTLYVDTRRCMNCRACETACKLENGVPAGPRWTMVTEVEVTQDGVDKTMFLPMPCLHCGDPACLKACPTGAISKRTVDGIVLVDKEKCIGCRQCLWACQFGVPQFGPDNKMEKCTLCVHRFDDGLTETACQKACQAEAIMVGTVDEISKAIRERYATSSRNQLFGNGILGR
ncbi:4Fe-4S dicluster domain-containing protein [Desulfitobacterium sp.]|uniref:4Fe-4S dicluster domain-containing protein n=1 Tax=Desulfitobacterium sp. TaxID=49981 RepID=UPI002B1F9E0F|nr:4Fe-4S dicluster domain-containing protein [Desulfitobacterium sp.]MEA4901581.1 4Fe-4S dicluster domain-containing protein [Desulfitobacterium sp.]